MFACEVPGEKGSTNDVCCCAVALVFAYSKFFMQKECDY